MLLSTEDAKNKWKIRFKFRQFQKHFSLPSYSSLPHIRFAAVFLNVSLIERLTVGKVARVLPLKDKVFIQIPLLIKSFVVSTRSTYFCSIANKIDFLINWWTAVFSAAALNAVLLNGLAFLTRLKNDGHDEWTVFDKRPGRLRERIGYTVPGRMCPALSRLRHPSERDEPKEPLWGHGGFPLLHHFFKRHLKQ